MNVRSNPYLANSLHDLPGRSDNSASTQNAAALSLADEASALRSARLDSGANRRILIVDDSNDSANSLAMILQIDGHVVSIAHDGLEALQTVDSFAPDTVFLDIGLPYLDGYDTCRHLRSRAGGEQLLIIAITGWNLPRDQERARTAGFDRHIAKPFDIATLYRVLADSQ